MAETVEITPQSTTGKRKGFRLGLRWRLMMWLSLFIFCVMGAIIILVREQQRSALDKEIRERGLSLARALAANSVEPLAVGTEATLQIMLLVKEVIQTSDDLEAGKRNLISTAGFEETLLESLKRFGRSESLAGLRNEGVIFIRVVDPEGKTIAAADVLKPQKSWFDELGMPYEPAPQSSLLAPGQGETTWSSPSYNGMYVIAVPILQVVAESGGDEEVATDESETGQVVPEGAAEGVRESPAAQASGQFMGSVYLGMSKSIVRRALADSVAKLLFVAGGVLVLSGLIALLIAHLLVSPIHKLRDGVLAVSGGNFQSQVSINRRDELGDLAASFNDMTKGLAERELIRSAFGTYVSSSVLDEIVKNPEAMKVGGSRRTVTMVDSDVRGFTSMSSQMTPEEVVAVINAYLDVQTKIITDFKGYVDRFVGDEVQAVFGVPTEAPDDAERAVRCAWAIKQAIARMVEARTKEGLPAPRIGIGVDTGRVVAGNMGAQGAKLDYTIIGEPVSMAKDLVDAARDPNVPGGQVVLSANTYELVKDVVEVKELDELETHGGKKVRIFDLVGLRKPEGWRGTLRG